MSFANLSAGWVLAGVAALAAVLFALQRLRVRHREMTVVTTLFWQEAVQEARARVLVDRFRHPLAYLLILLAASLLWIGAAEPRATDDDGRARFVLLDGSAGMAWGDRFDAARERAAEIVAAEPRELTTVILCGGRPRTLLLPGENELLFEERLGDAAPEACPETVSRTIREIAHASSDARPVTIHVVGDARGEHASSGAPRHVELVWSETPPLESANAGITRLGVSDARSGAWTTVDVLIEVAGTETPAPGSLRVTIDGAELSGQIEDAGEGRRRWRFHDVPATGAVLTATVGDDDGDDGLALDDSASVVLPTRAAIRVAVPENAPAALRHALETDPAVRVVAANAAADVAITRSTETSTPALILVRERDQEDAFVLAGFPNALTKTWRDLALDRIDATTLATTAGHPISLGAVASDVPQVRLWESLLGDDFDFTRQRAFPPFVAQAVRTLAATDEIVAVAAVGRSLPAALAPLRDPDGVLLDPADGELVPHVAGSHVAGNDERVDIALLDSGLSRGEPTHRTERSDTDVPAPRDLALWAGLLACVLLTAEWVLHRGERIP